MRVSAIFKWPKTHILHHAYIKRCKNVNQLKSNRTFETLKDLESMQTLEVFLHL